MTTTRRPLPVELLASEDQRREGRHRAQGKAKPGTVKAQDRAAVETRTTSRP